MKRKPAQPEEVRPITAAPHDQPCWPGLCEEYPEFDQGGDAEDPVPLTDIFAKEE